MPDFRRRSRIPVAGIIFFLLEVLPQTLRAEPVPTPSSIFVRPAYLDLYERDLSKLSDSEYWRVKIHGLRECPLDPRIWGTRKIERTENRRLVPIKFFYLRDSELPGFELKKIVTDFFFWPASKEELLTNPHVKDPVFEIGFGGQFIGGALGSLPVRDASHALRLSGHPALDSGMFFRSLDRYLKVSAEDSPILKLKRHHHVELSIDDQNATAVVDKKLFASVTGQHLGSGLVYAITGWNAVGILDLSIEGSMTIAGKRVPQTWSGLVVLPPQQPRSRAEKAKDDQERMNTLQKSVEEGH